VWCQDYEEGSFSPLFSFPLAFFWLKRETDVTRFPQIETSDISELTKSHLESELSSSDAPSLAPSRGASGSANGSGVDTSSGNGDAWNAFGPRVVGRPKPAGRR
jgi:hypothetical protein